MVNGDGIVHVDRLPHDSSPLRVLDGCLHERGNSGESKTPPDKLVDRDFVRRIEHRRGAVLRHQASRARARAGNRTGSGGSKVSVAIWVKSRRAAPGMRSGQARQFAIGTRMSGGPSWAIMEPSRYSTMPCTIDCGCTTMSIWPEPNPNR